MFGFWAWLQRVNLLYCKSPYFSWFFKDAKLSKADFCLSSKFRVAHYLCIAFHLVAALCVAVKYNHAYLRPSINVMKSLIFKSVCEEQLLTMEDSQDKPRGNIWNAGPTDAADEYYVSPFNNES